MFKIIYIYEYSLNINSIYEYYYYLGYYPIKKKLDMSKETWPTCASAT